MKGVLDTAVGYCGGNFDNPNYQIVCSGITGHAETVELTYDPDIVSYDHLLQLFFSMHNPTEGGSLFNFGSQYRAAVFYTDDEQMRSLQKLKHEIESKFGKKVSTEIAPLKKFWKAEEYHQQYYAKKGYSGCRI